MPSMDSSYYLPNEQPNYINFPEVRQQKANIQAVMDYSLKAQAALADYNEGRYDRIDLNSDEIQSNIDLCRSINEVLGNANNVCYDVLLDIREIHKNLLKLMYLKRQYGNQVIGTPTNANSSGGGI
jgi:hypothetical protein